MEKAFNWFFIIYGLLLVLWWLWNLHPLLACVVVCLAFLAALARYRDERRKQAAGFWVEILSPNQLRADTDGWAVVYHEEAQTIFFYGKLMPQGKNILKVPSALRWEQTAPAWAREKRALILQRVSQVLDPEHDSLKEEE